MYEDYTDSWGWQAGAWVVPPARCRWSWPAIVAVAAGGEDDAIVGPFDHDVRVPRSVMESSSSVTVCSSTAGTDRGRFRRDDRASEGPQRAGTRPHTRPDALENTRNQRPVILTRGSKLGDLAISQTVLQGQFVEYRPSIVATCGIYRLIGNYQDPSVQNIGGLARY
jgi:hypothetical protein